jgi:hypothetical protein
MGPADAASDAGVADDDAGVADDGGATDDAGATPDGGPVDSGAMDDGGPPPTDAGSRDAGCAPETDPQLCAAASVECGTVTVTDRCGAPRAPSCGTCTLPETCGGVSAGRCGCDVPTEVRSASCSFTSSGFRLRWGGDTTTYAYTWSLPTGTATSCGGSGTSLLFGSVGANSMIVPGGPFIGECRLLRLCTVESMCVSSEYSPGVVFLACVNGSGTGGTCTPM